MGFASDALFAVTALAYLAACVMFVAYLAGGKLVSAVVWAPRLVGVGAALHAAHIVISSLVLNVCPIKGMHFVLSVISMLACAGYSVARTRAQASFDVVGVFVAPVALTRMTEGLGPAPETDEEREMRSPRWIAPIVTWLASAESKDVTGRVFEASGNVLAIAEGWVRGPRHAPIEDPTALGPVVRELLAKARVHSGMDCEPGGWPQPK